MNLCRHLHTASPIYVTAARICRRQIITDSPVKTLQLDPQLIAVTAELTAHAPHADIMRRSNSIAGFRYIDVDLQVLCRRKFFDLLNRINLNSRHFLANCVNEVL